MRLKESGQIFLLLATLYLPFSGQFGLWDPWESQYGDVSSGILATGDLLSLKTRVGGEAPLDFWSKPPLLFWMIAGAMKVAGLAPANMGEGRLTGDFRAEWAARLPIGLLSIAAVLAVWHLLSAFCGCRSAWIGALVLATSSQWALLSRQAMTDIPFVACMTIGLCLLARALLVPPETAHLRPERRRFGPLSVPTDLGFYLVAGLLALFGLGQLLAMDRALELRPRGGHLWLLPYLMSQGLALWWTARARSHRQLALFAGYLLLGLAALAKGPLGLLLPVTVLLAFLLVSGDWAGIRRLDPWRGMVFFGLVAFPWYHAMFLRHGMPFFHAFILDHHVGRALGSSGDRGTFEYYWLWLIVGMFPWCGVAVAAIAQALRSAREDRSAQGSLRRFLVVWLVVTVALFSAVTTKFHHYVLPAVPALAMLCGVFLAPGERDTGPSPRMLRLVALPVTLAAGLVLAARPSWLLWLFNYDYVENGRAGLPLGAGGEPYGYAVTIACFAAAVALMLSLTGRTAEVGPWRPSRVDRWWPWAAGLGTASVLVAIQMTVSREHGGGLWWLPALLAISLFVLFNGERADSADARHPHDGRGTFWSYLARDARGRIFYLAAAASTWCAFVTNSMLRELSAHWSQREIIATYYARRRGADERLLAFGIRPGYRGAHGDCFYTMNRLKEFESPAQQASFSGEGPLREMNKALRELEGKRVFLLFLRSDLQAIRNGLPASANASFKIEDQSNHKLYLASVRLVPPGS